MMYLRVFCQFKSLNLFALSLCVLFVFFGCTQSKKLPKPVLMNDFEARWFKDLKPRYQRFDLNGDILPHKFFDSEIGFSLKNSEINFVVLSPANSEYKYSLDLTSGQPFMKEPFCKGKDISHLKGPDFFLPPYHEGFVPLMLDHDLQAQKIIVFGADELIKTYYNEGYFRANIIGGVILEKCLSGESCLNNFIEKKELVLIGVSKDDPILKNISSIIEFQNLKHKDKTYNWDYILSTLLNNEGAFKYKRSYLQTVKSHQIVSVDKAKEWMKKNNKLFNYKITNKLKKQCHQIYKDIEGLVTEANRNLRVSKLKDYLIKNTKYYSLCARLIQPVDPRVDHELHDFYNAISLPFLLAVDNNKFNCEKKQWEAASGREKFMALDNLKRSFKVCNANSFWELFQLSFPFSTNLRDNQKSFYRYIGYDNISGGSHQRIDSWVEESGTIIHCNDELSSLLNDRKEIYYKKVPRDVFNIYKKAP